MPIERNIRPPSDLINAIRKYFSKLNRDADDWEEIGEFDLSDKTRNMADIIEQPTDDLKDDRNRNDP